MTHQVGRKNEYHGETKTKLYRIWVDMRHRCFYPNNPNYRFYGLKGIGINKVWDKFTVFKKWAIENGYKPNVCIDRIDSNKSYGPSNCRWVSRADSNALRFNRDLRKTCKRGHPWKKETSYFFVKKGIKSKRCTICQDYLYRKKRKWGGK